MTASMLHDGVSTCREECDPLLLRFQTPLNDSGNVNHPKCRILSEETTNSNTQTTTDPHKPGSPTTGIVTTATTTNKKAADHYIAYLSAPQYQSFSNSHGISPTGNKKATWRESPFLLTKNSLFHDWTQKLDSDALAFGTRMSVCISMASLFVLIGDPMTGEVYPQGMWVIITVLFVCWFPSLDAASVVEKCLQRIYGTLIGAGVGLVCGFTSLLCFYYNNSDNQSKRRQAIFVGACIFLYTFTICWAALQFQVDGLGEGSKTKIISRYNYACILCLLTFYICILPFYMDQDNQKQWETSLYRVINVLIGCVLGAALSVFVLPRSTVDILQRKIETQIQLAGQASLAVLHHAADHFSDDAYIPIALGDELLLEHNPAVERSQRFQQQRMMRTKLSDSHRPWRLERKDVHAGADEALNKHEKAIHESRLINAQLKLLQYDPFQLHAPEEVVQKFRTEVAHTLARALRIQHTVVLIDGIIRNDPKHDFEEEHIRLFATVGTLIGKMLAVPLDEDAARELQGKMAQIRYYIVELASVVSTSSMDKLPNYGKILSGATGGGNSSTMRIVGSRHDFMTMWNEEEDDDDDDDDEEEESDENSAKKRPNNNHHHHHQNKLERVEAAIDQDDQDGKGAPKLVHGSRVCALLFLQLVEHLALRSIRLYESWKYCELLYIEATKWHELHEQQATAQKHENDLSLLPPGHNSHSHNMMYASSTRSSIRQSLRTLHQQARIG